MTDKVEPTQCMGEQSILLDELDNNVQDQLTDDDDCSAQYDYIYESIGGFIDGGSTGYAENLDDGTALKRPAVGSNEAENVECLRYEASLYDMIGSHPRFLRKFAYQAEEGGLKLEYMPRGNFTAIAERHEDIPIEIREKWAAQVVEAVALLHERGILHCDLGPNNFLLDNNLDLKIIDFAYSQPMHATGRPTHMPRYARIRSSWDEVAKVEDDIFALGACIYAALTGSSPYRGISSHNVRNLYRKSQFPDLLDIPAPYRSLVRQCFLGQFSEVKSIAAMMKNIMTFS